jgi:16S rRNA (cytosine1402-N4)-methyltransferase
MRAAALARSAERSSRETSSTKRDVYRRVENTYMDDGRAQHDGPLPNRHLPVLLSRVLELLAPALEEPNAVVVDATLGLAGHAEALLVAHPRLRLVGIDRDTDALALAAGRLSPFEPRITLVHAVYDQLPAVLERLGVLAVDGVLFDLGVSSMQLDEVDRGFSYAHDAPLDMRMDRTTGPTAADIVNTYSAADIARVLRVYGEERFASRIANAVVKERARQPLVSTARLAALVRDSIPAAARRTGGNPAKRTFQALRIEVNAELAAVERAIPAAVDAIRVGGRVVVLSYQSLEDRLVKRVFAAGAASTSPSGLPVELPDHGPRLRLLTRGAEQASAEEISLNPRAASVRLRAIERVRDAA